MCMSNNEFNLTHMNIQNIHSHYKVHISNDKANHRVSKFSTQTIAGGAFASQDMNF